nr:reverse transcriptase domain-containing protein [Tanacetum cinerariifolium]
MKDIAIGELSRKFELAQKEKDVIQLIVEKIENASKSLNKLIDCQIINNFKKGLGYKSYNAVPPPYTGNFMPLKCDLSYTGLDEFAVKPIVENKSSKEETKIYSKDIIITESSIRRDLRLVDEEGVDCLPNYTIFENLELMGLQSRVLELEKTKTSQENEIASLKRRVKKLERRNKSRTHKLKRLYKVGLTARVDSSEYEPSLGKDASKQGRKINNIDADEDITLVNDQDDAEIFDVNDLHSEEVSVAGKVTAASIATTDKGKGIMVEEPVKLKKKDQIRLDEEAALRLQVELQVEFDEEQRLTRERGRVQKEQEANIALIETWDDIQAKIDTDHQLAERLQEEEQQELSDAEKATLIMVNTFIDFKTELVEGSLKRPSKDLVQESIKKQKVEDEKETSELKQLMEIIPDKEEVAIDAIPLAVKSPRIVNWKIYKEGNKTYYQIMRAGGKSHIRSSSDPTLLNNSEMAAKGPGDLPVPDLQTMEELCQSSLNGRGGPIAPIAIQETNFGLKNDMIQQVQNSCQFHGLPGDDANKHLDKFLHVTQSIKVNGVTDDALRLYLFPHSLTHHSTTWFDRLPRNLINTFGQMAKMFLDKYFPPSMVTKLRNEITNFCQRPDESLFEAWEHYKLLIDRSLKAEMAEINKNFMRVLQVNQQVKAVTPNCETCGGPHSFSDCPATVGNTQNVYVAGAYQVTPNCETCGGPHSFSDCPTTVGNTQNVYVAGAYQ